MATGGSKIEATGPAVVLPAGEAGCHDGARRVNRMAPVLRLLPMFRLDVHCDHAHHGTEGTKIVRVPNARHQIGDRVQRGDEVTERTPNNHLYLWRCFRVTPAVVQDQHQLDDLPASYGGAKAVIFFHSESSL